MPAVAVAAVVEAALAIAASSIDLRNSGRKIGDFSSPLNLSDRMAGNWVVRVTVAFVYLEY